MALDTAVTWAGISAPSSSTSISDPLTSRSPPQKLTFNSEEIRQLSKTRSSQVRLPDLAHIDSLKHLVQVPARSWRGREEGLKYVPESRHASLFLAYLQEQDESTADLTLYNDVDFEPCPSWDFAYTNEVIPSVDIKAIDDQRKKLGWPLETRPGELKQGGTRGCSCGDGDEGDEVCNASTCACQMMLEGIDSWYRGTEEQRYKGSFHYDGEGRLKLASSYLHLCIFECTKACGCSDDCPNRVVQRGRKVPLEIFKTKHCGWGLRTRKAVKAGTFITTYQGELITNAEAELRSKIYDEKLETTYVFDLEPHLADEWANIPDMAHELGVDLSTLTEEEIEEHMHKWQERGDRSDRYPTIDAGPWGNVSRFLNHSCNPNLGIYYAYTHEVFDVHRPQICFFTKRDVAEGEELTFSYSNAEPPNETQAEAAKKLMDQAQLEEVTINIDEEGGAASLFLKKCHCGAYNCTGAMWTKPKDRQAIALEAARISASVGAEAGRETIQGSQGGSGVGVNRESSQSVTNTPHRSRGGRVPRLTPSHSAHQGHRAVTEASEADEDDEEWIKSEASDEDESMWDGGVDTDEDGRGEGNAEGEASRAAVLGQ